MAKVRHRRWPIAAAHRTTSMRTPREHRRPNDPGACSPPAPGLLERARALHLAAPHAPLRSLLAGRNVGLLCDDTNDDAVKAVEVAATALGAHVARVRPGFSSRSSAGDIEQASQLLGRFYDVLVCVGMNTAHARRLSEIAGIPVLEPAAMPCLAHALSAELQDLNLSDENRMTLMLQAALLDAMA